LKTFRHSESPAGLLQAGPRVAAPNDSVDVNFALRLLVYVCIGDGDPDGGGCWCVCVDAGRNLYLFANQITAIEAGVLPSSLR